MMQLRKFTRPIMMAASSAFLLGATGLVEENLSRSMIVMDNEWL
jgi:hypothetical protein